MDDKDKKSLFDVTLETLVDMKSREITLLGDAAYVGTCTTVAILAVSGIIKGIYPEANLAAPIFIGGISLIITIASYLKKKSIVKNAQEAAMKIVDCTEQDEKNIAVQKSVEPEIPAYDNLSLEDKCNLLIGYAREVSYPGFEDDAHILCDIIEGIGCYEEDDMQTYGEALKIIEQTMLEKAYKFYNGDFSR